MGIWRTLFKKLLLHAVAVVFKTFVVAGTIIGGVEQVESFEDVVGKWVAALGFAQWRTGPPLALL